VEALKLTPLGNVPVLLKVAVGKPVAVTVNVPAAPKVNDVVFALVIAAAWLTVSMKLCVAAVPIPLLAVKVMLYAPPVPAAGVPLSTPVEGLKVTPLGNVPVTVKVGAGRPVAVTVNEPAVPAVNVVIFPLVIPGGCVVGWKIANGEKEVTVPQMMWFIASTDVVTLTHAPPL
jgi:hypothetical protein